MINLIVNLTYSNHNSKTQYLAMNVYEIKGRLLDIIANINDETVLMELYKLTRDTYEADNSWVTSEKRATSIHADDPNKPVVDLPKYFSY